MNKPLPQVNDKKYADNYQNIFRKEGYEEGDKCNRDGCLGEIEHSKPIEGGCSCFQNPPCSYCTTTVIACGECGYEEVERY